jgi:hypothetical protein
MKKRKKRKKEEEDKLKEKRSDHRFIFTTMTR